MAHSEPDHTRPDDMPSPPREKAEPEILDPVSATEPTAMPDKKRNWFTRLFSGPGKISGGPAGPASQTGPGGTPLR